MTTAEYARQCKAVNFWAAVGEWLRAVAMASAVIFAWGLLNHLERLTW